MGAFTSGLIDAARMTQHLLGGLPAFLLHHPRRQNYQPSIKERLARREDNFLGLLERAVYPFASSPYRKLLGWAGCELGDVAKLVRERGLERALEKLRSEGVYVTLDEFKGRHEARRGSRTYLFTESDFDNPRLRRHFEVTSGGTRSAGTRTQVDLEFIAAMATDTAVLFDVHDLWRHDQAIWLPLGGTALIALMIYARLDRAPLRWFSQIDGKTSRLSFKYRLGTELMLRYGRLFGRRLPQPEFLPLYGADEVALWIGEAKTRGTSICLTTFASSAVRVCGEAQKRRLDIAGTAFITIGEPLTAARRKAIEAAGAKAVCRYAFTEAGILGYACGEPQHADDMHLLQTNLALIQARRAIGLGEAAVEAFYVTSLLAAAPKVLINVENGDYGVMQARDCSCEFGALGYSTHLAAVRSFEKLTGEGVTFAGADLARIIDEVLPARFGGGGLDYQVVEEEGPDGFSKLFLLVNPDLGKISEPDIVECFLSSLARQSEGQKIMAEIWAQSKTVQVRRERPVGTRAGKVFPFHLVNGDRKSEEASSAVCHENIQAR
jgi:hypothetical protein